jgi:hypothetical protein
VLSSFPTLRPDETLYSALARHHIRTGGTQKEVMMDLFGSLGVCAVTDLPSHLISLTKKIPASAYNIEQLLYKHTLYPYYAAFLDEKRRSAVRMSMYVNNSSFGYIHALLGLMASKIKPPSFLQVLRVLLP